MIQLCSTVEISTFFGRGGNDNVRQSEMVVTNVEKMLLQKIPFF